MRVSLLLVLALGGGGAIAIWRAGVSPADRPLAASKPHESIAARSIAVVTHSRAALPPDPLLVPAPSSGGRLTAPLAGGAVHIGDDNCCAAFLADGSSAFGLALAVGDFPRAAAAVAGIPASADRARAQRHLAERWAAKNPAAAARFAQSLPAGETRWAVLASVVQRWREYDVVAASAWLNTLEPTPDHDAAIAAIANHTLLMERHPEVALSWAESISAAPLREGAVRSVLRRWAVRDPAAVRDYVTTSPALSEAQREDLLRRFDAGARAATAE